jgi:hypothetical protein
MASGIPALPQDSHVQSHAAVHKNKLCDSHAPLVVRGSQVSGLNPLGPVANGRLRATGRTTRALRKTFLRFGEIAGLQAHPTSPRGLSLLCPRNHQHAVAAQYVLELVVRQGRDGPVVRAGHGAGGDQRIDNGLLNALDRCFEQGV